MITNTITRDTENSFIQELSKDNDETFFCKMERGTPEYSNTCLLFHIKSIPLEIGSKLVRTVK